MSTTEYRIYADGNILHQDDFAEADGSLPYYDDYKTIEIPDELIDFIVDSNKIYVAPIG